MVKNRQNNFFIFSNIQYNKNNFYNEESYKINIDSKFSLSNRLSKHNCNHWYSFFIAIHIFWRMPLVPLPFKKIVSDFLASVQFMLHLHVAVLFTLLQTTQKVTYTHGYANEVHCQSVDQLPCLNLFIFPNFNRKESRINISTRTNWLRFCFLGLFDLPHVNHHLVITSSHLS